MTDNQQILSQLEQIHFLIQESINNLNNNELTAEELEEILYIVEDAREGFFN